MNKIAFKVKKAAEKSILQGHPWVYESSIIKQNKDGKAGDLAIVFDQRNNKLLAIGLYDPSSIIRIRILHVGSHAAIDKLFFKNKFDTALRRRAPLLATDTTAYRLTYGENDGLAGLITDVYNDHVVIKFYSEVWVTYLDWIKEILKELVSAKVIIVRLNRNLQKANLDLQDGEVVHGVLENEEVIFMEHGLKFKANLIKGHKTGYFLDHRNNRLKIRTLSKGKTVLDIFSYAGGFSINAIAGGAKEVISLDISAQALEIARANVALNFEETGHKTLAMDAFEGIELLRFEGKKFDLIICDPPSFAKSEDQIPRAIKSYQRLIKVIVPIIAKNGMLLMASCSSRVQKEVFYNLVVKELSINNRRFDIVETAAHDVDHPEDIKELSYLKAVYVQFD